MKRTQPWHDTPIGVAAGWLGSIQFAVPILAMVAVALAWGTYLESTQDARVAKAAVYGSWWFIALMGLVCVSLIFAVIMRIPWKRKHVGFIIVHASLVTMIIAGFMSMYGRIEGHIALEQGVTSGTIEMDTQRLELVEHDNGQFRTLGEMDVPLSPGRYTIGGFPIDIVAVKDNVREEFEILDDGSDPYRAVQLQFGPMAESAVWVGDEAMGPAPLIDGMRIRVLSAGKDWQPPEPKTADPQVAYAFVVGDQKIPLAAEGQETIPGWKVVSVKRYAHAKVVNSVLSEDAPEKDNPAIEVTITDGKGTTELHTAFVKFPDMVLARTIEGTAKSGARLVPPERSASSAGGAAGEETLVIYGTPPAMKVGYIARNGAVKLLEHADGAYPWVADLGARKLPILKQFTHAREESHFVDAPPAKEHRPAVVFKDANGKELTVAWKGAIPFSLPGRVAMLRYNPRTVPLPFSMRLDQFRKTDYPGTEMAMAYESDITAILPDSSEQKSTISMNNPLVQSGWKVYQSGFMGNTISIFSVMRDPGLVLTYISSVTLCVGILITFYGRGLSWGHPGIPAPFSAQEPSNVTVSARVLPVVDPAVNGHGGRAGPALDPESGGPGDPGRASPAFDG